jgi:starvation-inducible DNA-binding protein
VARYSHSKSTRWGLEAPEATAGPVGFGILQLHSKELDIRTFNTRINLDENTRSALIEKGNALLASTLDLQSQVKQAHWNIKGPQFFARHELFDDLAKHLREWSDDLAERVSTLGGQARGTVRLAGESSRLREYDVEAVDGRRHLQVLAERYGDYTRIIREMLESKSVRDDVVTEDLLTEIARGSELDMWFLESHLQG